MKESVGTPRVYLGLVGGFNTVSNALVLVSAGATVFSRIVTVVFLGVSLALLYVAVALPTLLRTRGPLLIGIFRAYTVMAALNVSLMLMVVLVGTMNGQPSPDGKPLLLKALLPVLGLGIAVYLSRNIVRLVGEAKAPSQPS